MFKKKEKPVLTEEQKKKKRKRKILGGVAILGLAVFVLPGLFAPKALPQVAVAEAYKGSVLQTIEGSGAVKSEEVKTYFSPVSAKVASFDLKVGDIVQAGDLLLTYDEKELDQLYRQAELTGSAANYGYQDVITKNNENVSEYKRSSEALDIINRQLEEEKGENEHVQDRLTEYSGKQADSANELAARQMALEDAQTGLKAAQSQLEAVEAEKKEAEAAKKAAEEKKKAAEEQKKEAEEEKRAAEAQGDAAASKEAWGRAEEADKAIAEAWAAIEASQKRIDDGNTQIAALHTNVAAAVKTRDEAMKRIQEEQENLNAINEKLNGYRDRLTNSSENLEKLQTSKAKEEGIQASSDAAILSAAAKKQLLADNQLSSLSAQMTKEEIQEGKEGIRAEFSGVVTEVSALAGGPAAKGGSLFTIASSQKVVVDMPVTRYDLEKLETGQEAQVTLAGRTYQGTLTRLSRLAADNATGTPTVSAEIRIEDPDEYIYLGLEAKVRIQGREAKDVIVVPVEAVNTGKEGSFVYTVEEGRIVKKQVETGLVSDTLIEIGSGLNLGEQVVTMGAELVEEGMAVMIREDET